MYSSLGLTKLYNDCLKESNFKKEGNEPTMRPLKQFIYKFKKLTGLLPSMVNF